MLQRLICPRITRVLKGGKSVLLLGPRQAGKTTLLKSLPHTLYLSLARAETRLAYERDPARLSREVEALDEHKAGRKAKGARPLVVLDEIQKVPALLDPIQEMIDNGAAQFILTGSSARKLRKSGAVNLLPGRIVALRLDPFALDELSTRSLSDHLLYGDLPEIALARDHALREQILRTYVETYLNEEVRAEALVRGIGPFSRFLELAAIDSGRISNLSAISKQVGPTVHTIGNYYDVLVDCLIAERVEPITKSPTRKKLTRSPKYLFFDLGVRRVAADEGVKPNPERMGQLFEHWVGLELLRHIHNRDLPAALRFWRDPDGPEVDWVVERQGDFTPIEVKWSDSPTPRDARHLEVFLDEHPKAGHGYVVCRASRPQKLTKRVTALPWRELASVF